MTSLSQEEVSFKTLNGGLTLRGTLYLAGHGSPAIIITPGFNVTRDVLLPRIAQRFQRDGIAALIYDPRTIGSSDGDPRNDINPAEQMSDYHDALTFLKRDGRVDPERIAYWGFSFSGAVALNSAALDKRAKAVISVCPLTNWDLDPNKWRGVMAKAMQDRESQLSGNAAFSLPMILEGEGGESCGVLVGDGSQRARVGRRSEEDPRLQSKHDDPDLLQHPGLGPIQAAKIPRTDAGAPGDAGEGPNQPARGPEGVDLCQATGTITKADVCRTGQGPHGRTRRRQFRRYHGGSSCLHSPVPW
ncbi:hypothetical protein NPX13_g6051 [Xylaria arbuscula]|uniref:Serine aminopeptidase S33 domain-containing protein n=1 Tax=Xylaria arbuscula TaxID=114810 RepID=A0A9W8ND88_9PEZI|nr:hypothetical protein NPX13_g6051 [Xylaria arbuscula]